MKSILIKLFGPILLGLLTTHVTYAQNPEQGPGGKPPQTAILACSDIAESTQCSFQGPRGLESGSCEHTPDKQYFACKPARGNKQSRENQHVDNGDKTSWVKQYPSHLVPD